MNAFVSLIVLFMAQQWIFQKDLITQVIRNTMIARQQTQLKEYFSDQTDPTYVCSDDGYVVLSNPAGLSLYNRKGCLEVQPSKCIFKYMKRDIAGNMALTHLETLTITHS